MDDSEIDDLVDAINRELIDQEFSKANIAFERERKFSIQSDDQLSDTESEIRTNEGDNIETSLLSSESLSPTIPPRKKSFPTCLTISAGILSCINGVLFGYDIGIISGALLQLKTHFQLNCKDRELLVSSALIGGIVSYVIAGLLVDKVGRKVTIIINCVIFTIASFLLAFAQNFSILIFARLLVGCAVSLSSVSTCIYMSEIAISKLRGRLVSLYEFGITLGFLVSFLVSYLLITTSDGWRYMFGLASIPSVIQALLMLNMPKSPRYLLLKNKEAEAINCLRILRGHSSIETEIHLIKKSLFEESRYNFLDLFRNKDNMMARMGIAISIVTLLQFSGQPNILFYSPTIFQHIGFHKDTASTLATVGLGLAKCIFTGCLLFVVDRFSRRRLLTIGCTLMLISMALLAITLYNSPNDLKLEKICIDDKNTTSIVFAFNDSSITTPANISANNELEIQPTRFFRFLVISSLITFVIGFSIGFGPISWLILSEIFPTSLKGRAFSVANIFGLGSNILVSMTFLDVTAAIGLANMCTISAIVCLLSILFVSLLVPETRGRTLEQVSKELQTMSVIRRVTYKLRSCFSSSSRNLQTNASYESMDSLCTSSIPNNE
ncbi:DgyrCDS906 [Dimorphilus gyrociliatus]|uniref:DgyrCDS906 n=1 Tax=Dimorphilus gyrociliatus TaxID=2664684 RepID=A0A7I8V7H6_9ANNE|nr:DgyrCDS906 [Dimorphilus gyrociliatus]